MEFIEYRHTQLYHIGNLQTINQKQTMKKREVFENGKTIGLLWQKNNERDDVIIVESDPRTNCMTDEISIVDDSALGLLKNPDGNEVQKGM